MGKDQNTLNNPRGSVSKKETSHNSFALLMMLHPLRCYTESLRWPQHMGVTLQSGDKKVNRAFLEHVHHLFFLGHLKVKLEERFRHEKMSYFL